MSDSSIKLSSIAAFSYHWNKCLDSNTSCLIRLGKSMAVFFKTLFCGYTLYKVDVTAFFRDGHENSIFIKECNKKFESFNVEIVNKPASGEQNTYDEKHENEEHENKKNDTTEVSSDSNKQESLYIQNDESKELERDSVENTLFDELEKLINDKNFKSYSEYFSEDKLNFLNTEDCCWLFNRALIGGRSEIALLLLLTKKCDQLSGLSNNVMVNALVFFAGRGVGRGVEYLLDEGLVEVNGIDCQGDTALIAADRAGQKECVKMLLEAGATDGGYNLNVEIVNEPASGEQNTYDEEHENKKNDTTEVPSDFDKQESLCIQNDELKELEGDNEENTLFNELEKLMNDKDFKSYSESFSEDKLNLLNTEECCRLFDRALIVDHSEIALRLLLTKKCDQLSDLSNDGMVNALVFFVNRGVVRGVKYLLGEGLVEVNGMDFQGDTALVADGRAGQEECIKILMEASAKAAGEQNTHDEKHENEEHEEHEEHENKKNDTTEVSSDSDTQESLYIQNDELKELDRDSEENTLFNELEKLTNDKNFKSYSEYFSEEQLNLLNTEECCRLFNRALIVGHSEIALRLLLTKKCDQLNDSSNYGMVNALVFFAGRGIKCGVEYLLDEGLVEVNGIDSRGDTALMAATKAGQEECLQMLLDKGVADVSIKCDGFTPLFCAVLHKHIGCFNRLLKAGATIDDDNHPKCTLIHCAVMKDCKACLKALVELGADVNKVHTSSGLLPLQIAIKIESVEMVKALLEVPGIEVNKSGHGNDTSFHTAVKNKNVGCFNALLSQPGIEIDLTNDAMMTPLSLALLNGDLAFVEALLGKNIIDINQRIGLEKMTPLHYAVMGGSLECLKKVLGEKDIQFNVMDRNRCTPFDLAIENDRVECLKELLTISDIRMSVTQKMGSDSTASAGSYGGIPPLHRAAGKKSIACLKELLTVEGIDINARDDAGCTPFLLAISANSFECFTALLREKHIDIYKADMHGNTALHKAAENNYIAYIKALLTIPGIDISRKNNYGLTARNILNKKGDYVMYKDALRIPLAWALLNDKVEDVEKLLGENTIDINQGIGFDIMAPLHYAVKGNSIECFKKLLGKNGINLNVRDFQGLTPLHYAAEKSIDCFHYLLAGEGIDINAGDDNGCTPLLLTIKLGRLGRFNALLREEYIDVNKADKYGRTPLHEAAVRGNLKLLEALLAMTNIDSSKKNDNGRTPLDLLPTTATNYALCKEALLNHQEKKCSGDEPEAP